MLTAFGPCDLESSGSIVFHGGADAPWLAVRRGFPSLFRWFLYANQRNPHGIFMPLASTWRGMTSITATAEAAPSAHHGPKEALPALMLGAIGVVFGDIGTSPLYAMKESFIGPHPLAADQVHIFGVLSLIFWTLMLVVTVKYVAVTMRAHNKGEGGSFALLALISQDRRGRQMDRWAGHAWRSGGRSLLRRRDHHAGDFGAVRSRGPGGRRSAAGASHHPRIGRHPCRPVPDPGPRDSKSRRDLRADHPHLFRDPGRPRRGQHHGPAGNPRRVEPSLGGPLLRGRSRHGLSRPRQRGAGRYRRGSALRRHGPFRPQGDRPQLADAGLSMPHAQLSRPGRAAARNAGGGQQSLLPDGAGMGAIAAGRHRHAGHRHRQPGRDFRRVLGHSPGHPAWLPAAPQHPAHQRQGGRPDLHSDRQLDAAPAGRPAGARVQGVRPVSRRPMASPSPARCSSRPA